MSAGCSSHQANWPSGIGVPNSARSRTSKRHPRVRLGCPNRSAGAALPSRSRGVRARRRRAVHGTCPRSTISLSRLWTILSSYRQWSRSSARTPSISPSPTDELTTQLTATCSCKRISFTFSLHAHSRCVCGRGNDFVAFQYRHRHEPLTGGGSTYRSSGPMDPRAREAVQTS